MVFTFMKMLSIFNMTMEVITMYNVMNIFNGVKPQEYPQEKQGTGSFYDRFCRHEWRQR